MLENTKKKSPTSGYIYKCKCVCGNICEKRSSYLTTGETKSCGCLSSYYNSKNNGGTGIPGETLKLERAIRLTPKYKELMLDCLKRANYQSELSGCISNFEVHHKNSISYLLKIGSITKENYLFCEELYDAANLIVLTKEEHKVFHSKFGFVTTKEMWETFEKDKTSYLSNLKRPLTKKREIVFNEFKGKIVGFLTLIEELKGTHRFYSCLCSCGNTCTYQLSDLKRKDWSHVKTCGKHKVKKDLTGQQFGELKVIKFSRTSIKHKSIYWCKCSCGNEKEVYAECLTRNTTKSCGKCGIIKTGPKKSVRKTAISLQSS